MYLRFAKGKKAFLSFTKIQSLVRLLFQRNFPDV